MSIFSILVLFVEKLKWFNLIFFYTRQLLWRINYKRIKRMWYDPGMLNAYESTIFHLPLIR